MHLQLRNRHDLPPAQHDLAGCGAAEEQQEARGRAVGAHIRHRDGVADLDRPQPHLTAQHVARRAQRADQGGDERIPRRDRPFRADRERHQAPEPSHAAEDVDARVEDDERPAPALLDVGDRADQLPAVAHQVATRLAGDLRGSGTPERELLVEHVLQFLAEAGVDRALARYRIGRREPSADVQDVHRHAELRVQPRRGDHALLELVDQALLVASIAQRVEVRPRQPRAGHRAQPGQLVAQRLAVDAELRGLAHHPDAGRGHLSDCVDPEQAVDHGPEPAGDVADPFQVGQGLDGKCPHAAGYRGGQLVLRLARAGIQAFPGREPRLERRGEFAYRADLGAAGRLARALAESARDLRMRVRLQRIVNEKPWRQRFPQRPVCRHHMIQVVYIKRRTVLSGQLTAPGHR